MPDGPPVEEPESSADTAYENIPPPFGQYLSEQIGSTISQIGRVAEQGLYQGVGRFPRLLYGGLDSQGAAADIEMGDLTPHTPAGSVPSPMMSPEQYNERYAPIGNDGKPVSLGSEPMPQAVAKLVGDAKREEIERENVTSRFENVHSWPTNFAAGTLGYMLDPLRAATAFVPGIGEEAIAARLGGGFVGRLAGRVVAGAEAGAVAQAPISALQYGLGQEEASDYSLRDAFRDIAFGAAGNAFFHAGVGTAGELLRGVPHAGPVLGLGAQGQHAAMSSAVGELAEGRPVQVEPFFERPEAVTPADIVAQQRALNQDGFAAGVPEAGLKEATADIYAPRDAETGKLQGIGAEWERPMAELPQEAEAPQQPGVTVEEADPEIMAAEQRAQQLTLLPEERQEIDQLRSEVEMAKGRALAIDEAASCLKEAGF